MNPDQNILTVTEMQKEIWGQDENRQKQTYSDIQISESDIQIFRYRARKNSHQNKQSCGQDKNKHIQRTF